MRKFLVFVAGAVLLFLLFMTVASAVAVLTFTPTNIKKWLKDGDVYKTVISSLTKQGETAVAQTSGDTAAKTNSDEIQAAITKSVSPEFLQTSTEKFIDGTTPWLEGKTDKPTFAIDVSAVKQTFIQELSNQARTRYAALPPCAPGQIPDTSDIFNVPCQVPGVNIEPQIQQAIQKFNVNQEFLPNSTITPENLKSTENGQQKPVFDQLHDVPTYYKWARISPFVLGGLALICALIIIFASTDRRNGAKRVMIALGSTGIILLLMMWFSSFGVRQAQSRIEKVADDDSVVQNTAFEVVKLIQRDMNKSIIIFAAVFLVIAAGLLTYLILTRTKTPKTPDTPSKPDEKPAASPKVGKPAPKPPKLVQINV